MAGGEAGTRMSAPAAGASTASSPTRPGRETDDAEILRAAGARSSTRLGFSVELKSPDELPETDDHDAVPPFLFVMCERIPIVEKLAAWERRGTRIVNAPAGIRNTDRERTIALFAEARRGASAEPARPDAPARAAFAGPCWLKRGDVHATEAGDVSFAGDAAALDASLGALRRPRDHARGRAGPRRRAT